MATESRAARRPYRTGDGALDAKIAELVEASAISNDRDLLTEMLSSCFRVARDRADRGEMKMGNAALKEFAYAFKVFKAYRGIRKVSMFGSSRSGPEDRDYACARDFAKAMAERGWMVITGAGPGVMEAGHEGAGAERSFGAAIRLPMEVEPNVVIEGDPKLINLKYLFNRKVTFLKESHAFALFPGGFGITDSSEAAVAEIEGFYRNYPSQRFVDGTLVLRLQRLPDGAALARLSAEFADILRSGAMRPIAPAEAEVAEGGFPGPPRPAAR